MKKSIKRLELSRETLRHVTAAGDVPSSVVLFTQPVVLVKDSINNGVCSYRGATSNIISQCGQNQPCNPGGFVLAPKP